MRKLKICIFVHSWISDWNHGNAHFLRGLASELVGMGHDVRCYEPLHSWSISNLFLEGLDQVSNAFLTFHKAFPMLDVRFYEPDDHFKRFAERELQDADLVIVHEWNSSSVARAIGDLRSTFRFKALFHDTHHRAYTSPGEIARFPLDSFDGVLAFGEAIRRIYIHGFNVRKAWNFHEAADVSRFKPMSAEKDTDVVWVGNWGDEERRRELEEFLIAPASQLRGRKVAVHGVRYPVETRTRLGEAGIEYRGYLPNLDAPKVYARSLLTLHVPRKFYSNGLSGVPTIRVFEALACGIPLLCSPWADTEGLFRPGQDYICVADGRAMQAEIRHLLADERARQQIAANGLETIRKRHTCRHRALELLDIYEELSK